MNQNMACVSMPLSDNDDGADVDNTNLIIDLVQGKNALPLSPTAC